MVGFCLRDFIFGLKWIKVNIFWRIFVEYVGCSFPEKSSKKIYSLLFYLDFLPFCPLKCFVSLLFVTKSQSYYRVIFSQLSPPSPNPSLHFLFFIKKTHILFFYFFRGVSKSCKYWTFSTSNFIQNNQGPIFTYFSFFFRGLSLFSLFLEDVPPIHVLRFL